MARQGIPVYKYNVHGELVDCYLTIRDAAKAVRMDAVAFKRIVNSEGFVGGYVYSWSESGIKPLPEIVQDFTEEMPWEKNGFFDINGWGKACL